MKNLKRTKKQVAALTEQNSYLTPRADYYYALCDQNLLTNFRDTAKELHIKEKDFINWLISHGYIYRKGSKLRPYTNKKNMRLFEVKILRQRAQIMKDSRLLLQLKAKIYSEKSLQKQSFNILHQN